MGQQSILEVNKDTYREYFEKQLSDFAKKSYIESKFRVGKKVDRYELKYNLYFSEILDKCNCEIDNYLWQKINGLLDAKGKKIKINRDSNIYVAQSIVNVNNTNNITNVTNLPYQWSSVVW